MAPGEIASIMAIHCSGEKPYRNSPARGLALLVSLRQQVAQFQAAEKAVKAVGGDA